MKNFLKQYGYKQAAGLLLFLTILAPILARFFAPFFAAVPAAPSKETTPLN